MIPGQIRYQPRRWSSPWPQPLLSIFSDAHGNVCPNCFLLQEGLSLWGRAQPSLGRRIARGYKHRLFSLELVWSFGDTKSALALSSLSREMKQAPFAMCLKSLFPNFFLFFFLKSERLKRGKKKNYHQIVKKTCEWITTRSLSCKGSCQAVEEEVVPPRSD